MVKFDKWINDNKDGFWILSYKKVAYSSYWRDLIVRVYKTIDTNKTIPYFRVDYGSKEYPSSKGFKTKSEALKFAKSFMKKN